MSGLTFDEKFEVIKKATNGKTRRAALIEVCGSKCIICGCEDAWSLEFHHLGHKRFMLSINALSAIVDPGLILEEASGCALLCSNCHKGVHAGKLDEQLKEALERR